MKHIKPLHSLLILMLFLFANTLSAQSISRGDQAAKQKAAIEQRQKAEAAAKAAAAKRAAAQKAAAERAAKEKREREAKAAADRAAQAKRDREAKAAADRAAQAKRDREARAAADRAAQAKRDREAKAAADRAAQAKRDREARDAADRAAQAKRDREAKAAADRAAQAKRDREAKAAADRAAQAKRGREAKAAADRAAQAKRDREARAAADRAAQAKRDREAKAAADRAAQAKRDREAKAAADRAAQAKRDREASAAADRAAQEKRDREARAIADQRAKDKAAAEAKALADQRAKDKAAAEAKALADQRAKDKAAAEAKALADQRAKDKAAAEAKALADQRAKDKAAAQAKALADQRAKDKAAAQAKALADQRAKDKAAAQAKALADQRAKDKAAEQAKALADQRAKDKAAAEAKALATKPIVEARPPVKQNVQLVGKEPVKDVRPVAESLSEVKTEGKPILNQKPPQIENKPLVEDRPKDLPTNSLPGSEGGNVSPQTVNERPATEQLSDVKTTAISEGPGRTAIQEESAGTQTTLPVRPPDQPIIGSTTVRGNGSWSIGSSGGARPVVGVPTPVVVSDQQDEFAGSGTFRPPTATPTIDLPPRPADDIADPTAIVDHLPTPPKGGGTIVYNNDPVGDSGDYLDFPNPIDCGPEEEYEEINNCPPYEVVYEANQVFEYLESYYFEPDWTDYSYCYNYSNDLFVLYNYLTFIDQNYIYDTQASWAWYSYYVDCYYYEWQNLEAAPSWEMSIGDYLVHKREMIRDVYPELACPPDADSAYVDTTFGPGSGGYLYYQTVLSFDPDDVRDQIDMVYAAELEGQWPEDLRSLTWLFNNYHNSCFVDLLYWKVRKDLDSSATLQDSNLALDYLYNSYYLATAVLMMAPERNDFAYLLGRITMQFRKFGVSLG